MGKSNIHPFREYRVVDVLDGGNGESRLIGHSVMLVRELDWGARPPSLPRGFRYVEIFHRDELLPLAGRFRRLDYTCMCPARPYPHRWTSKCRVSPQ